MFKRSPLVYNNFIGTQRYQGSVGLLIGSKNLEGIKDCDYSTR